MKPISKKEYMSLPKAEFGKGHFEDTICSQCNIRNSCMKGLETMRVCIIAELLRDSTQIIRELKETKKILEENLTEKY